MDYSLADALLLCAFIHAMAFCYCLYRGFKSIIKITETKDMFCMWLCFTIYTYTIMFLSHHALNIINILLPKK